LSAQRTSLAVAIALVGCATAVTGPRLTFHAPGRGPRTLAAAPSQSGPGDYDRQIAERFEAVRAQHQDLEYPDLVKKMEVARAPDAGPSFDPTGADYYRLIRKALELTSEEQEIFKRTGIVGVDHGQRYSMASAYLAIYRRDLPVLITSDSILHAMHRSFDNILIELENGVFMPTIKKLLADTQAALRGEAQTVTVPPVRKSAEDIDLYLTVARNLIEPGDTLPECDAMDADLESCAAGGAKEESKSPAELAVHSELGQDAKAAEILGAIMAEDPDRRVSFYGRTPGPRIDWSQFRPRGHYTKSFALKRYFRTMMWLGRVDVGFNLGAPDSAFGKVDVERELRDAALLSWVVRRADQAEPLADLDRAIGFLVGRSDNVTVGNMEVASSKAGVYRLDDLAKSEVIAALAQGLAGRGQRIRSQFGARAPGGGREVPLPDVFQLFGQRFAIDSFVLSKVVFDSIDFKGEREQRGMPSGVDVMAALGNDEAVALAEPDLRQWHYAANLLAARRAMEERPPAAWDGTQYDIWLSALSKLDDVPAGTDFPEVMRSQAWARKQLQTQLGSWAELRHDTILYAKQSYTMGIICEYPTGYVEPYPEFYARVARFADQAKWRIGAMKPIWISNIVRFLDEFGSIVRKLEGLARKELAGQPFDADEKKFIKETIRLEVHRSSGGCGGPRETIIYTGWYPKLIYNGKPESWEPTVADVHTADHQVLEAAVGDVNFLVAAIDNRGDRAAYVGPVYSYYEFASPTRLTDEEWRKQIQDGRLPPRPEWVRAFQAKPVARALTPKK
jgi:hypothetical protein